MTYLAAAVQRSPGLTLEHGIEKAVAAIEEAGREGASLIVFPETWIPSYPYYHSPVGQPPGLLRPLPAHIREQHRHTRPRLGPNRASGG